MIFSYEKNDPVQVLIVIILKKKKALFTKCRCLKYRSLAKSLLPTLGTYTIKNVQRKKIIAKAIISLIYCLFQRNSSWVFIIQVKNTQKSHKMSAENRIDFRPVCTPRSWLPRMRMCCSWYIHLCILLANLTRFKYSHPRHRK